MILVVILLIAVLACAFAAPLDVSVVRVLGAGGTTATTGDAISLLSSGNIVLSGSTTGNVALPLSGQINGFIRTHSSNGTTLWTKQVFSNDIVTIMSTTTDSDDNIYAVVKCSGIFYGASPFGNLDVCFIKYDSKGNKLASFNTGGTSVDWAYGIAVNQVDRTVWMVGYTNSIGWNGLSKTGTNDAFILKYSISGSTSTLLGAFQFGVPGQLTQFLGVALDSAGNTVAVGYSAGATYQGSPNAGAAGTADLLIQKTRTNGTVVFARLVGGSGSDLAFGVALDPSDNSYAAGYASAGFDGKTPLGGRDVAVVMHNSAGIKQWSKLFGGAGTDQAGGVVYDKTNNVLLVTGFTTSPTFQGVTNPITTGTGSTFLLVLVPSTGAIQSVRLYPGTASGGTRGNAITTDGASLYFAGTTTGAYQGQALSGSSGAFMLKAEGYGAAPSAKPSALPTASPSRSPSAAPTTQPSVFPSSAPTRVCVQWALGDSGESCSATCNKLSRNCKESYFAAVVTQDAFYAVVASSVNVRTGQTLGSAAEYCSAGFNTVFAGGAPAAETLLFVDNGVSVARTACSYPTSLPSSTTLSCDAELSTRRFCPCVDNTCDAPPAAPLGSDTNWYLGDSGDSCTATCSGVGRDCDALPLSTIKTDADFLAMVAASTDTTGTVVQSNPLFCNGGTNVRMFASAPAIITTLVPGAANRTSCNYPILSEPLNGACGVSFPQARRFCSCKMFPPTAAPTTVPTAVPSAVPTSAPTARPTATPSAVPTVTPSEFPTASPSTVPSVAPTVAPSASPTPQPSTAPSVAPTADPSSSPTLTPTEIPSAVPTALPTVTPTASPSVDPTAAPTLVPTFAPTTAAPTATPTVQPTENPTLNPTWSPSDSPTLMPSLSPTVIVTAAPTVVQYVVSSATVFGSNTMGTSVTTLSTGDVIIVGAAQVPNPYRNMIVMRRYSRLSPATGNLTWAVQFGSNDGNNLPYVTVDSSDNIYLAYTCQKSNIQGYSVMMSCFDKYDSTGTAVYQKLYLLDNTFSYTYAYGITVDSARQFAYVVGMRSGSSSLIIKYNTASGAFVYATFSAGASYRSGVVVNSAGIVWTVGVLGTTGSSPTYQMIVQRLSSNGAVAYSDTVSTVTVIAGGWQPTVTSIAIDANDDVYVLGNVDRTSESLSTDIIVVKYSGGGGKLLTYMYSTSAVEVGQNLLVDNANGVLYVTGSTNPNPPGNAPASVLFFVLSLSDLSLKTVRTYANGVGNSIALSSTNVYIAGNALDPRYKFQGQTVAVNPNAFLLKLDRPTPTVSRRLKNEHDSQLVMAPAVPSLRGAGRN